MHCKQIRFCLFRFFSGSFFINTFSFCFWTCSVFEMVYIQTALLYQIYWCHIFALHTECKRTAHQQVSGVKLFTPSDSLALTVSPVSARIRWIHRLSCFLSTSNTLRFIPPPQEHHLYLMKEEESPCDSHRTPLIRVVWKACWSGYASPGTRSPGKKLMSKKFLEKMGNRWKLFQHYCFGM